MSMLARLRDPKLWLAAATLALVLFLVLDEAERATSPGPLTSAHAAQPELADNDGCERCHASAAPDAGFAGACAECHSAIGEQLAAARGFHGKLDAAQAQHCELCHVEHHGDAARLVDERAFALAGVADVARFEHAFTSFELVGAHTALECAKCHRNADAHQLAKGEKRFLGLTQRCAECHEDPHKGKFDPNCASCHGQSSFTALDNFVHTSEFPLVGRHAGLECASCHAADGAYAIEVVGAVDYARSPRSCQACHSSPHAASFVAGVAADLRVDAANTCEQCHSSLAGSFASGGAHMDAKWHGASGFELRGAHRSLDCASCHASELGGFRERHPGGRAQACASCHEDPHAGQFGAASNCASCHSEERWTPSRIEAASHTSFALTGAHAAVDCAACHAADAAGARVFRGAPRACESCHADAHEQRFERQLALVASEVRAAGGNCGLCHDATRFDDVERERFDHAHWTGFELAGAHARATCEACHARSKTPDDFGRTFGRVASVSGAPVTSCINCHRDAHRGAFDSLYVTDAQRGVCAQCHGVESFRPALASFDHALTGFVLDGAHSNASCEQCHGPGPVRADPPRALGFVADLHQASTEAQRLTECATCHADVHSFSRAAAGADPGRAQLARECSTCHSTSSFAQVERARFDHAAWTGFPLDGAHAATSCEACHVPAREPDEHGRKFGRAAGTDCSACHVDVHAGQFAREGVTDCARCHDARLPLREVRFDHQRDARFALDKNHAKLACAACHRPTPTTGGRVVVRYKPLGIECADCHGVSGRKGG